jgi:hypothetical protein
MRGGGGREGEPTGRETGRGLSEAPLGGRTLSRAGAGESTVDHALCRGGALAVGDAGQQVDDRLVGRAGLGGEPGQIGPDVSVTELGGLIDTPGEKAAAERAERDQPASNAKPNLVVMTT